MIGIRFIDMLHMLPCHIELLLIAKCHFKVEWIVALLS